MARLATRVAHSAIQARSLAVLMYLQRGIPIIYYGEELGLENLTLPDAKAFSEPRSRVSLQQLWMQGIPRRRR